MIYSVNNILFDIKSLYYIFSTPDFEKYNKLKKTILMNYK